MRTLFSAPVWMARYTAVLPSFKASQTKSTVSSWGGWLDIVTYLPAEEASDPT